MNIRDNHRPADTTGAVQKDDERKRWLLENARAIEERRTWIEANGTPLADLCLLLRD